MAIRRVPARAPPAQALASVGACFGGGASAPCGAGSHSCPSTPAARAVRWGLAESGGRPLQYSSLLANPPQAAVWGEQVWGVSKGTRLGRRRKPRLGCRGGEEGRAASQHRPAGAGFPHPHGLPASMSQTGLRSGIRVWGLALASFPPQTCFWVGLTPPMSSKVTRPQSTQRQGLAQRERACESPISLHWGGAVRPEQAAMQTEGPGMG